MKIAYPTNRFSLNNILTLNFILNKQFFCMYVGFWMSEQYFHFKYSNCVHYLWIND